MIRKEFSIEKVSSIKGFLELENVWDELLFASAVNEPYLTFEWQISWWKNFGARKELYILLVKLNDEVCGIAPFMIHKIFGFKVIKFIGSGWSDFLNFIIKENDRAILDTIFGYLVQDKKSWHIIELSDVLHYCKGEKKLLNALQRNGINMITRKYYVCPYIPIESDFNSF